MKVCLNIETIFADLPIHERVAPAAEAGFTAVEFWMADAAGISALASVKQKTSATYVSMVANSPDGAAGGSPVRAEDREEYFSAVAAAADSARSIGATRLITCSGNLLPDRPRAQQRAALTDALRQAGKLAEQKGITLVLEPLNTRTDHPGYFLDSVDEAADIVRTVGSPAVKLLMDIYHTQIMHGDIIARIREHIGVIGHFHAAGVPGRHELFTGELNYTAICETICSLDYAGHFGLEYYPALPPRESLAKTRALLQPFMD